MYLTVNRWIIIAKRLEKNGFNFVFNSKTYYLQEIDYYWGQLISPGPQANDMRIQFEIKEKLPDIIGEILNSEKWMTLIKEDISGRKLVVIRDQAFDSEATVEIYSREVTIKTAWSRYTYRLFVLGDCVWCEYNGAYRGLLEQKLLPSITPKESLLDSEVLDSSLYGHEKKKLREYAEDNLKLKKLRRENFNENRTGVAPFDHPKKVYDEFIKEDYIAPSSKENNKQK